MERIAGMTLRDRYGDWNRAAFTSASQSHISVWQKALWWLKVRCFHSVSHVKHVPRSATRQARASAATRPLSINAVSNYGVRG
jgi:hypothetical protein